ncbi:MAG: FixH family protein [Acidobacteriota bacterium]
MRAGKRMMLALIVLGLALPPVSFAHGDEDHGDKKKAVAAGPGMIARTARVGDYEVMVKHPVLEPLHEHAARIFVTRYATNEPIKDAVVSLVIAFKRTEPVKVAAKASARPGEYEANLPPLDAGTYNLSAMIDVGEANWTANYGEVAVERPKPTAESSAWDEAKSAWLLALGLLMLLSATGFLAWRRRVVRQPQG